MKLPDRVARRWGVVLMPLPSFAKRGDTPILLYDTWDERRKQNVGPPNPLSFTTRSQAREFAKGGDLRCPNYFYGRMRVVRLTITTEIQP